MISVDLHMSFGAFQLRTTWESPHPNTGVFGPSGAGKTTMLYAMAGLVKPQQGRIVVDSEVWFDSEQHINLSPQDRGLGFVFQDSRLFPHWSVKQNLLASQSKPSCVPTNFDEIVSLFELESLLPRRVRELSGGETKRVALGRALLRQPKLLILDEPLTGLDATLRRKIFGYLLSLKTTVQVPLLYVSHRFSDLLSLTDWIVFMEDGNVVEQTAPQKALEFVGEDNSIETTLSGKVLEHDGTGSRVDCGGLALWAPRTLLPPGSEVRVTIKAEDCVLAPEQPPQTSAKNCFPATVEQIIPGEGRSFLELSAQGSRFWAELTPTSVGNLGLRAGTSVYVLLKVRSLRTGP